MNWRLVYTRQARKDAKKLAASGLKAKAQTLLEILEADPPKRLVIDKWQNQFMPELKADGTARCTFEIELPTT